MTTPNNSDQSAMHDELRARHVAVLRRLLDGDTAARAEKNPVLLSDEREAVEYFAALTLPASEAVESVRWHPKHGFNWKSVGDGPCGDTGTGWIDVPLYTTPQPAPAAMPVDALRELRDGAVCDLGSVITDFSYDMSDKAFSSLLDAAQKITDELTALLSGGAAREEAK